MALPMLAAVANMPVRKVSERTRQLYEYAQGMLHPPKGTADVGR